MSIQTFDIIPQLQPYVREICIVEFAKDDPLYNIRVLPDTCIELFINFGTTQLAHFTCGEGYNYKRSFLTSRMSRYMDVTRQAGSSCIAVCFKPGQAYRFFSLPMSELTDKVVELEDLWKVYSKDIEERIALANDNNERALIVQELLRSLLTICKTNDRVLHAFELIHLHKGQLSIEQLSKDANISHRQLARRFHQLIGLSPKEYANMNRFLHSLQVLKAAPQLSLTEVSYESGYYDQSHFIHEYRRYTGITPSELLQAKNILF